MKPYTLADAEAECAAAMAAGEWDRVPALAAAMDRLDTGPRQVALGNAALWYAQQGMPVFPIRPGAKVPLLPAVHPVGDPQRATCKGACGQHGHGCHDATTNPTQVAAWWQQHPHANIGLATGHRVDVIDFDGLQGHASWGREFPDEHNPWGGARVLGTVSTPRPGGLHAYVPASGQGNGAAMFPGVDYRGRGGYVLAPPSVLDARDGQHPGTYRFLRPLEGTP